MGEDTMANDKPEENESSTESKAQRSSWGEARKDMADQSAQGVAAKVVDRVLKKAYRAPSIPIGQMPNITHHAGVAGAASAVTNAAKEAYEHLDAVRSGEMDKVEYAAKVAGKGAKTGASNAGKTVAALGLNEVGKEVARRVGGEGLKRIASSNVATAVAFGVVEQTVNTVQYARGNIDDKEYGTRSVQNVGATGGALAGASAGAVVGSVVPVVGTVIGAFLGGVAGAVAGSIGGRKIGSRLFGSKRKTAEDTEPANSSESEDTHHT